MKQEIVPYHPAISTGIAGYLRESEEYWTGLTSRLFRKGKLLAPARKSDILTLIENSAIRGVVYNTSEGYTFPAVHWPWTTETEDSLQNVFSSLKNISTLMGDSHTVDLAISSRNKQPAYRIDYLLMARPASYSIPGEALPGGEEIFPADRAMARALYPLQKDYEIEEVLLQPDKFNSLICMTHLKETLNNQIVFAARRNRRFVAKAGTNAQGLNWAQIGGVYTAPEFRGQGISRRLMQRVLQKLAETQQGATLFVKKTNGPAIHLYRKIGFYELAPFSIAYFRR